MAKISTVLALCVLLFCASCSHEAAHEALTGAGGTAAAGAAMAAINGMCPMSGEKIEADGGSADFDGKKVGFCCKKCVGEFAALDNAGKLAALAAHGTQLPK